MCDLSSPTMLAFKAWLATGPPGKSPKYFWNAMIAVGLGNIWDGYAACLDTHPWCSMWPLPHSGRAGTPSSQSSFCPSDPPASGYSRTETDGGWTFLPHCDKMHQLIKHKSCLGLWRSAEGQHWNLFQLFLPTTDRGLTNIRPFLLMSTEGWKMYMSHTNTFICTMK